MQNSLMSNEVRVQFPVECTIELFRFFSDVTRSKTDNNSVPVIKNSLNINKNSDLFLKAKKQISSYAISYFYYTIMLENNSN